MKTGRQKILPSLWFDKEAEEAVTFYTSLFEDSRVISTCNFPEAGQEIHRKVPGSLMTIDFELDGLRMVALNGGPRTRLNPSISFFVLCNDEREVNRLWKALIEEGSLLMPLDSYEWSERYGWLTDKYGVSWQLMLEKEPGTNDKIIPLIFFTGESNGQAQEALQFYTAVFDRSDIQGVMYYGEENTYAAGFVQHAQFQLEGQTFMAMDSDVENNFPFNEAVSFIVLCKDQHEINYYWEKLSAGGDPSVQQFGWLKDKFGISWQVLPESMDRIFKDPDRNRVNRATVALLGMKKIDVNLLDKAFVEG